MKSIRIVGVFLLLLLNFISCKNGCQDFKSNINPDTDSIYRVPPLPSWTPSVFESQGRFFYLSKIWGFATYHGRGVDIKARIDSLLFKSLTELEAHPDMDKATFNGILLEMLHLICLDTIGNEIQIIDMNDYSLITNDWMTDTVYLNKEVRHLLAKLFNSYAGNCNLFCSTKLGQVKKLGHVVYNDIGDISIRLFGLFDYWNFINYYYPNKNAIDENWDSVLYVSIPDFVSANNETNYRKSIYRLVNHLHDTHASFPATIDTMLFGQYRPKFIMKMIDNTLVISSIRDEEHYDDDFQVGDVVLQVDDMDAHHLYDSLQQYVGGGNYWSNQRFVCNAVLSRNEKTTKFIILRDMDTLLIESHNETYENLYRKEMVLSEMREKKQLWKWLDDDVAYLDMSSVTHKNFNKNYSEIEHASAIILDLRNYPDNAIVLDVATNFVPDKSIFAYTVYPDVHWPGKVRYSTSTHPIGSKNFYKGILIVLVDEHTQSFSEYLTMMLQANSNTIVVGSPSSGANGNVDTYVFPGGINSIYTSLGVLYPDLTPTQRTGVQIDYLVEPTISSIKEKRDVILEEAVIIAHELMKK